MDCNQITLKNSALYRLYAFFRKKKTNQDKKTHNTITNSHEFKVSLKSNCENKVIQNLFKQIKPYEKAVTALLHGSWADQTNNSFSDIDDFIILEKDKITSKKDFYKLISILNKIDMSYCRIDPIQHHGHWLVCSEELKHYDNSFMPLFIMKDAKRIIGKSEIIAYVDDKKTQLGLKNNIINTCKNIERLYKKYHSNKINSYEMKCLVGSFALVPSFVVQLQQLELNKPESIKHSIKLFSKEAYTCVAWATNCRNNWTIVTNKKSFKMFKFLTRFCTNPHLWRRFSERYSPKIHFNDTKLLSTIELKSNNVSCFLNETLKHLSTYES